MLFFSIPSPVSEILNQKLQITFLRARPDVTYIVEASSGLSADSWTTLATNPGTLGQSVTVTDTSSNSKRFLRLKVTHP